MQISFNHHKNPIKSFNHHSNQLIEIIKVIQSPFFPWFSHGFPLVFSQHSSSRSELMRQAIRRDLGDVTVGSPGG
jgi:hypothetical protein